MVEPPVRRNTILLSASLAANSAMLQLSAAVATLTVVLVVGCYLGLALWCLRAVLPHPASTIATTAELPAAWRQIIMADQKLVVAMTCPRVSMVIM